MKITDLLVSQHLFLRSLFDSVERALDGIETSTDVAALARMVEALMEDHAEAEENLFFRPLETMLMEKGQLSQFYTNHKEYIALLKQPQAIMAISEAKTLLRVAFRILRAHFHDEERVVIPLAQATFQPESLERLGAAWLERYAEQETRRLRTA